jgi:prepilin-type N-terminal cleavage/methylation domain-containing protein
MFMKNHKKLNKRGFTLAESVLALAVIAIASVGILSLILSAQRSTFSAMQKQQAQIYAADIISCYRVSNSTNFADNVEFALGITDFTLNTDISLDSELKLNVAVDEANKTVTAIVHKGDIDNPLIKQVFTKGDTP